MNIQVTAEQALLLKEIIKAAINSRKEVLTDRYFITRWPKLTDQFQQELSDLVSLKEQLFDAEETDPVS